MSKVQWPKLDINPEIYELIPRPTKNEYNALKNSIKNEGQQEPIVVWSDPTSEKNYIIDGHTRFEVCKELDLEPKVQIMTFESWVQAKNYAIDVNLYRRHLNDFQKAELLRPLLEINQQIAENNMKGGTSVPNGAKVGRVTAAVSKNYHLSTRTFERALYIIEHGDEQLKEKVRNNEVSISYAANLLKRESLKKKPTPKLPDGQYDLIEMDLPWDYDLKLEGSTEYKTMTVDEIKKEIPNLPMAKNCVIAMWVTNGKIEEAAELAKFWGLKIRSSLVWVKTRQRKIDPDYIIDTAKVQFGNGFYARGAHEMLWICIKGKPGIPSPSDVPLSVFFAERTTHSKKPDIAYEILEKMYPRTSRLQMFARGERAKWTSWGDELK